MVFEARVTPLGRGTESWPPAYRSGVAAGLLLDDEGGLTVREMFVSQWPRFPLL